MQLRILVVDDEANIRLTLSMCVKAAGHAVLSVSSISEAYVAISQEAFDLMFLDLRLGTENGLDHIEPFLKKNPLMRVVVITAYASIETAVQAMKLGASDYLSKPFEAAHVHLVMKSVAERTQLERRVDALRVAIDDMDPESGWITTDPALQATFDLARQVASSKAALVITGETGTGKTRLARAIHRWSDRSSEPFFVVSCRRETDEALKVEMFGDAQAAANSAPQESLISKVASCRHGTLVLEEIGELSIGMQPEILRLIEQGEFERANEFTRHRTDVRVIATTSVELSWLASKQAFRSDLLLAINVVQIDIPPLRARSGDVLTLAQCYLEFFNHRDGTAVTGFAPEAMHVLQHHQWPGNHRELQNVVERAILLCRAGRIGVQHLPANLINSPSSVSIGDLVPLDSVEELHIRRVVASTRSLRQAAVVLDIDQATLVRRMQKYNASNDKSSG